MRITDIHIDGFGVWNDLALRKLSPEITVFYGPNEAGKTTLMHFLRTIFYGASGLRRDRYLPPLAGGRPGGSIRIDGEDGELTIQRYADRGPDDVGKVTILMPDGTEQGDRLLREALEHVDESTFNNIFAVGLSEIQELGSLSDTAAAQWLYRLTSGLDRVSLYDVIHLLRGSLIRLVNSPDQKSQIRELIARRDQLRGEMSELINKGRRWAQSAVKLGELADEINDLQVDSKRIQREAQRLETAINLKPIWERRARISEEIAAYGELYQLPESAISELDELNSKIEQGERQRDILKAQRHQLRDEAQSLGINEILVQHGCRLEALSEQQQWLTSLHRQAEQLQTEVESLESRLHHENQRLAERWAGEGSVAPDITTEMLEQLAPQARAIEAATELVDKAKADLNIRQDGEQHFRSQLESAKTSGEKLGLPDDMQQANDLVAGLRRRQKVEQDLEKARQQQNELHDQTDVLVEDQLLPIWRLKWLLGLFVFGALMIGTRLVYPTEMLGSASGWLAPLGIAVAGLATLLKYAVEQSAARRMEECDRELTRLERNVAQAREEQEKLDHELPMSDGSVNLRLQQAERHLEELEKMLPVETKRREVAQEIEAAQRRLQLADEKRKKAIATWRGKLKALGLPAEVAPADLPAMLQQVDQFSELRIRLENRSEEQQQRQREFDTLVRRIRGLAEESGLSMENAEPLDELQHLLEARQEQQARIKHRESLKHRAGELKIEEVKHARAVISLTRRRTALFERVGVDGEKAFRRLARQLEEISELQQKHDAACREIVAGIGRRGREEDFAPLLAADTVGRLEHDWEGLTGQLDLIDQRLKEAIEERGRLIEQQRRLAEDRSLGYKQIELDEVEIQIARAKDAWRDRATVNLTLERIRHDYERHRQPETLTEASQYMSRLTGGRYARIWTPLANDILLVETSDGDSLPVDVLSRGTREQLFVSLRLALVKMFARRGIQLPMILDDVLVNFDAGRARVAAEVFREFAEEGHQLFVFTCHEHVWRMFRELKGDARRLPDRYAPPVELEPEPEAIAEVSSEPQPLPVIEQVDVQPPAEALPEPEPVMPEPVEPKPVAVELPPKPVALDPTPEPIEYVYQQPEPRTEPEPHQEYEYAFSAPGEPLPVTPDPELIEVEYSWPGASHEENVQDWLPGSRGRAAQLPAERLGGPLSDAGLPSATLVREPSTADLVDGESPWWRDANRLHRDRPPESGY